MLYVNGGFTGQRVTGQQRYAGEVTRRLASYPDVDVLVPPSRVQASAVRAHLWAHTALPLRARGGPLISLTARSPAAARSHVVVVHDLFVLQHPEWYSSAYRRTHVPVLLAQLRTARGLVAVSQPVADELSRRHPRTPVVVAPNAPSEVFSLGTTEALPAQVERLLGADATAGYLFAVGSTDPRKNFGGLVEAFNRLPQDFQARFPLVIAGGVSSNFAAVSLATSPHLHHVGFVTDEQLAALYARAAGVVVPSFDEGFGLPLVEAMAAGASLAVSRIPAFEWVAGPDVAYFDPLDPDDMARAIQELVLLPEASATGARVSRFNWDATARVIHAFASDLR